MGQKNLVQVAWRLALYMNGKKVGEGEGEGEIPRTIPFRYSAEESVSM